MTTATKPPPLCTFSQIADLLQLAYQLGLGGTGQAVHCAAYGAAYGAARWEDLTAADAEAVIWGLRRALLLELDAGGQLEPPRGRFYDPAERSITPRQLEAWRRRLAGPDGPDGTAAAIPF
jgi:hypothetical protein